MKWLRKTRLQLWPDIGLAVIGLALLLVWLPEPLAVPTLMLKSLITSIDAGLDCSASLSSVHWH